MSTIPYSDVDFIEELRLRRWAREHYVPSSDRDYGWHPIVLEEMSRKDEEAFHSDQPHSYASAVA